jgi:pyocin large subunit-like protein
VTVAFAVIRWALEQTPKGEGGEASSSAAKFVLVLLANHARKDGRSWPAIDVLARESGLSERAVRYALEALEAEGLIVDTGERLGRTARTRRWRLAIPGNPASLAENPADLARNPADLAEFSKDKNLSENLSENPRPGAREEPRARPVAETRAGARLRRRQAELIAAGVDPDAPLRGDA